MHAPRTASAHLRQSSFASAADTVRRESIACRNSCRTFAVDTGASVDMAGGEGQEQEGRGEERETSRDASL
jgi:hypothetical protein